VEHFDKLCDRESITLTFDCSTAKALLLFCSLCLASQLKKGHPRLRLSGLLRLRLW
jgi:hypothetical protein